MPLCAWRDVREHPPGLAVLFFTELWERFSYYGMRAILVLYMTSPKEGTSNPGLGWTEADALALYGWYSMSVYLASIPGGLAADRCGGPRRCVMIGGFLLCAGHGVLAINALWGFYLGLALIVVGCGALKPNISTLVGGLYPLADPRRDMGFTIFYIGINVGAFASSLVVGYIGERVGWHYGFGLAGVGMVVGQIVYAFGQRYITTAGEGGTGAGAGLNSTAANHNDALTSQENPLVPTASRGSRRWATGSGSGAFEELIDAADAEVQVDVRSLGEDQSPTSVSTITTTALPLGDVEVGAGAGPATGMPPRRTMVLRKPASTPPSSSASSSASHDGSTVSPDAPRVGGEVDAAASGYTAAAEQGCDHTLSPPPGGRVERDRLKLCGVCFLLIIVFWGAFEQGGGLMNIYTQQKIDRSVLGWEVPASTFQALNPLFIMVLGTPVAGYWRGRQRRGEEASSMFKMAVGMVVMGAGFLAMCGAAVQVQVGAVAAQTSGIPVVPTAAPVGTPPPEEEGVQGGKAGLYWLVAAYVLHTVGELCASPVALSFVTKLAPPRHASTTMGLYFASSGLGNKLAGLVGEVAARTGALRVFAGIFLFCAATGAVVWWCLPRLKRLAHGAEGRGDGTATSETS